MTTLPPSCAVVMKSRNLNFMEPSGPLQACNRTALPLAFTTTTTTTTTTYCNFHNNNQQLLLLIKRYNLFKVLACSTTFFHLSLLCATFFQLCTFMLFIPSKTSSSQRILGLPIGLLDMGFHLLIFCTVLSSAMRLTWPNQFSLCFLINPTIFCPFNMSLIS